MLNSQLSKIKLWLRANKHTLNTQKSKFMLFYKPRKTPRYSKDGNKK